MKKDYIILILVILLVALSIFTFNLYFKNEPVEDSSIEELKLRDSISVLQIQIDLSKKRQIVLQHTFDSLRNLEPQIIYRTHEKIKFIYSDASPSDLDAIIRSNWKTPE